MKVCDERKRLRFGSLFAGIGGFDLGLERAGMECAWQVEIDPFCREVLAKHWPRVPKFGDIKEIKDGQLESVDLICGGFPCQDISCAGKRVGIEGSRSGLWSEYARIIRILRPRYVLVENVAALLVRGVERVLGDLAALGFDAEWDCLPASAFGAPHQRDRVFVVAYTRDGWRQDDGFRAGRSISWRGSSAAPADAERGGLQGRIFGRAGSGSIQSAAYHRTSLGTLVGSAWQAEPAESWLDDGIPSKLASEYSRAYGNAVVPQVVEWIGRRIVGFDNLLPPLGCAAGASHH